MFDNITRVSTMILGVLGVVSFFAYFAPERVEPITTSTEVVPPDNKYAFQKLVKEYDVQGLVEKDSDTEFEDDNNEPDTRTCPVD